MSMKNLKKALKKASDSRDDFEVGTVITWVASGRYNYAAIKAGNGLWYTTAAEYNRFVSNCYEWADFLEGLTRSEVSSIKVSETWVELT